MPLVILPGEELYGDSELGRGSGLLSSWDLEFVFLLAFHQLFILLQALLLASLLETPSTCMHVLGEG